MTKENFNGSEFLYRYYMLLRYVSPRNEREEIRSEMVEKHIRLVRRCNSRAYATLYTALWALRFAIGIRYHHFVSAGYSFREEALRLKGFFSKLNGIFWLLLIATLCLNNGTLTLYIALASLLKGCLWLSFDWTFNHGFALKVYGVVSTFMIVLSPPQSNETIMTAKETTAIALVKASLIHRC